MSPFSPPLPTVIWTFGDGNGDGDGGGRMVVVEVAAVGCMVVGW